MDVKRRHLGWAISEGPPLVGSILLLAKILESIAAKSVAVNSWKFYASNSSLEAIELYKHTVGRFLVIQGKDHMSLHHTVNTGVFCWNIIKTIPRNTLLGVSSNIGNGSANSMPPYRLICTVVASNLRFRHWQFVSVVFGRLVVVI